MNDIQGNIARLEQAISDATSHCMCLRHTPGLIIFPEGFQIDGVRFPVSATGYKQAIEIMEQVWKEG